MIGKFLCLLACSTAVMAAEPLRLENDRYAVELDGRSGAIRRVFDRVGKIELITEPSLAGNFTLKDAQRHELIGKDQELSSSEKTTDGLTVHWKSLKDVAVIMHIHLTDSGIEFTLSLENQSTVTINDAMFPILGGLTGFGERADTHWTWGNWELNPPIPPEGPMESVHDAGCPYGMGMPWSDIWNPKLNRGLYLAIHDLLGRQNQVRFSKRPGPGQDLNHPVGEMKWTFYPYLKPGEKWQSPPVVLAFHDGDWHEAAHMYRHWFTQHFKIRDPRKDWLRQEMAYMDTMFLLPEGNVLWRFKDIPRWAQGALQYGVKTVLISGWHTGGHDAGYPAYVPDPRLGTWDELAAGIRECHRMGVRVLFFVNTNPIRIDTEWYQKELKRYAMINADGGPYGPYAFGMGTVAARLGMNTHQFVEACVAIPAFRDIIVRQMKKLAEIGADGLHVDKFVAFGLDLNPLSELPPDRSQTEGQLLILKEIIDACRSVNPEFALSLESHRWDRTLEYANVCWAWPDTWSYDLSPLVKFTFPEWVDSLAVVQPYDYNVVNNAVRYGNFMLVGPGHYTDTLGNPLFAPIGKYIQEIQRIREELKDTIYMGEFRDTLDVDFSGSEKTRCSTHRNPKTGKRAAVVVNFDTEPREVSIKSFTGNNNGTVRIYQPFTEPKDDKLPLTITIPGERLVIVIENE